MNKTDNEYTSNKDYLAHALAVLELVSGSGVKFQQIFDAAGDYWLIIRKDFISRGIFRPIGTEGLKVAPDRKEMIEPTLAHYRYLHSEIVKAERERRLDARIKKSGAWCGWLAIIISAISLSVSLCSRYQEPTPTAQTSGTSASRDSRTVQDTLHSPAQDNRVARSPQTVSDTKTKSASDSGASSKAR